MNTNNNTSVEAINEDYEYLQYNEQIRIIHSIKDDFYQMKSIVVACKSKKDPSDWLRTISAQELIEEISGDPDFPVTQKLYEKRENIPNNLKGLYVNKILVNHVAMWASPRYSYYIMKLLDSMFEQERQQQQTQLQQQQTKIDELLPRAVPRDHKHDYRYLIWKEIIPDNREFVRLHLVRRNKHNFRVVYNHLHNEEECWYYKNNLPISMSPNQDIKEIIKKNFGENDVKVSGFVVVIRVSCLPRLHELVDSYFKSMSE
ncbi:hypothetical protein M9Y10_020152 [Tritrichomonas musculus]|uniref:KilA-N domain-containing protein n=1 Tax=Tritrichomonas musculus TaxID=1915356 RepID=A0ABR2HGC7_9EUKA